MGARYGRAPVAWELLQPPILRHVLSFASTAMSGDPRHAPIWGQDPAAVAAAFVSRSWLQCVQAVASTRLDILIDHHGHDADKSGQTYGFVRYLRIRLLRQLRVEEFEKVAQLIAACPRLTHLDLRSWSHTSASDLSVVLNAASTHCLEMKVLLLPELWALLCQGGLAVVDEALNRWENHHRQGGLQYVQPPTHRRFHEGNGTEWLEDAKYWKTLELLWRSLSRHCSTLFELPDDHELACTSERHGIWTLLLERCRELRCYSWTLAPATRRNVDGFSRTKRLMLQHLNLEPESGLDVDAFKHMLQACPSLEDLRIDPTCFNHLDDGTSQDTVSQILATHAPRSLRRLEMVCLNVTNAQLQALALIRSLEQLLIRQVPNRNQSSGCGRKHSAPLFDARRLLRLVVLPRCVEINLSTSDPAQPVTAWPYIIARLLSTLCNLSVLPTNRFCLRCVCQTPPNLLLMKAKDAEKQHPGLRVLVDQQQGVHINYNWPGHQHRQLTSFT